MRARTKAARERDPEGDRRATLLELFFDLVYVVALAQVSHHVLAHLSWIGLAKSAVLLGAVWWVWAITAFLTDTYDPHQVLIQLLMIAVMLAGLLMAAAAPHAFDSRGLIFAGAYVGIHLGRGLFLLPLLHGWRARTRATRIFFWFAVSAVPWIVGALMPSDGARLAFWAAALAIDYLAYALNYMTPRLGRLRAADLVMTAGHLAERYQQFFMIALGDAILVTGLAYSDEAAGPASSVALLVAFATTVLVWRIYTHRAGEVLPQAIESVRETPEFFRTGPYTHLVMVAGVVAQSAAFELVVTRPLAPATWWTTGLLLGGPAIFVLGRCRFEYEVFRRVSPSRVVALGLLAVTFPAMLVLPLLGIAGCAALILAGMAAADTIRSWGRPPEQPVPGA